MILQILLSSQLSTLKTIQKGNPTLKRLSNLLLFLFFELHIHLINGKNKITSALMYKKASYQNTVALIVSKYGLDAIAQQKKSCLYFQVQCKTEVDHSTTTTCLQDLLSVVLF